jgi:putative acetyltransferase
MESRDRVRNLSSPLTPEHAPPFAGARRDGDPLSVRRSVDQVPINIRPFSTADAIPTLEVFQHAIRTTAAADYSSEQIAAWAPVDVDTAAWLERRSQLNTVVAVVDDRIAGFTDVSASGYIDMMFVDPAAGRRGIATALLLWARTEAERLGSSKLTTHASITARPFFEAQGFIVDEERHPILRGVVMTNYAMTRTL